MKLAQQEKAALVLGGTAAFLAGYALLRKRSTRKDPPCEITTWLVSETTVKADPPIAFPEAMDGKIAELRETISEVDEWLCRSSHWLGFCYRFEGVLSETQVRGGIGRTLSHIPALGARVDATSNPKQYELVLTPERQGVVLEVARGRREDGCASPLPDAASAREEWKEAGLDAPPPGFSGEPGPDDPMMRARLTVFEDEGVSYLSIGISHGLGDGHSIVDALQIWSHFCTSSSAASLPQSLRAPRSFGLRVTKAMRPAKDVAELEARVHQDIGCNFNPLSKRAFFGQVLPRAIWTMSRQQVFELQISGERMASLKSAVMDALSKGDWVSRFEVLCAAIIVAQRATGGHSECDHRLHVACNLRGRANRFGADYFGNASFDFRRQIELPLNTTWDLDNIVGVAQEIHQAIRAGLADPEDITKTKDWFEAARHLGLRNKYDVWPIIFDTLKGTGTFINSWDSRWLRISMGSKQDATAFQAYIGTAQNLIVEVPRERESGDTTLHLALPPKHAKTFTEFCQKGVSLSPLLPFCIISKRVI